MATKNTSRSARSRASDAVGPAVPAIIPDPELEAHIAANRIEMVFQPQFNLANGRIVGVEALARLPGTDDAKGLFARAAAAGLSQRLSHLVQRKALRCVSAWPSPLDKLGISINFLPEDIARDNFATALLAEIERFAIAPDRVTVEITEDTLIAEDLNVALRLGRLRERGVRIAVDDFGTGFASLIYLSALPLDVLKIDRGLIARIEDGERDRIVVRAIVGLARELRLELVIEGVETAGQLHLLTEWGCDLYQGFLGARPMSETELARFLVSHQSNDSGGLEHTVA